MTVRRTDRAVTGIATAICREATEGEKNEQLDANFRTFSNISVRFLSLRASPASLVRGRHLLESLHKTSSFKRYRVVGAIHESPVHHWRICTMLVVRIGASGMPCATGALPLACILVALAHTTTLFVGNGLCAVPVSLQEKGDGTQAVPTNCRKTFVGEIHESPTRLKRPLFFAFRRIRNISHAGDS